MTAPDDTNLDSAFDEVFSITLPPRPYPGLRPFEKHEWPIFFGRERMADAIIDQLLARRLLVLHGDSGCGKSSLVRAGVLPRLEQESARGGVRWRTCTALPREAPLWNLARALAGLPGGTRVGGHADGDARTIEFRRALNFGREAPAALAELLDCGPANQVCILIDQFEELFEHARRHGASEAMLLTQCLVGLLDTPPPGLHAVLTMRSEFLGACSRFAGFAEAVNVAQYLLPRMDHDDLMRAIREPATLYDGEVARELAERLIVDGGGGQDQLPLIQHSLMLLYNEQVAVPAAGSPHATAPAAPAWRLGLAHYDAERGLAGLLSAHADRVCAEAEQRCFAGTTTRAVEHMFRALTDINADGQAIRRPRTLAQLIAVTGTDETALRCAIDAFRADGVSFLKPYGQGAIGPDELIDISHEALIRCWQRIAEPRDGWLMREFRSGMVWRALLVQADSFERDPGNVLGATTTEEREHWLRRRNPVWAERHGGGWDRVHRLIAASVEAREQRRAEQEAAQRQEQEARRLRRRTHRLVGGLAILTVTSLLGVAAWYQSQRATAAQARAEAARDEVVRQLEAVVKAREAEAVARAAAENVAQEALVSARALAVVVSELEGAASAAGAASTSAEVKRILVDAQTQLNVQVGNLSSIVTQQASLPETRMPAPSATADLAPRVSIHIADPGQRAAARALELKLEALRIGDRPIVVPGIDLVKAAPGSSVLRCFRSEDCGNDGEALVQAINAALHTPAVTLDDFSARYGISTATRARHYELWFAPGAIELSGQ